jgi:hypothetical protein
MKVETDIITSIVESLIGWIVILVCVETDIITSIAVSLIGGIVILVSVCVETFKTDVIVFVANFIMCFRHERSISTYGYSWKKIKEIDICPVKYRYLSFHIVFLLLSWSWSYGSWIYNYLCNQCLSPLTLWVWIRFREGVFDTTLCDKVCQLLATGRRFFLGTLISSTNKLITTI